MSAAELDSLLAQGLTLREIGDRIGLTPSAVSKMAKRLGVVPPGRALYGPRALEPEELAALTAAGATERDLAIHFGVNITTVRRHLSRHGLKTQRAVRLQLGRDAGQDPAPVLECPAHGSVAHRRRADGALRCPRCATEAVARRRRKIKATLVREAGGRCEICGYDTATSARSSSITGIHSKSPSA